MKRFVTLIMLAVSCFFLLLNQPIGNAAGNVQEKYCPIGTIISLNNPNTIYNASNKEIVELIEKEPNVFAIRCIKPGDVYIDAFTKINGQLFHTRLLVHITENETSVKNTRSQNKVSLSSNHQYYNENITAEQAAQADAVAKSIANRIMSNPNYKTDLQKVRAAAEIVAQYAMKGKYGADSKKYYRTPYGVFISGNFTCAGTTRSLGLVLEFMGFEWQHVNENEWKHQWCVLTMDGKIGYADANVFPSGMVDYGEHKIAIESMQR